MNRITPKERFIPRSVLLSEEIFYLIRLPLNKRRRVDSATIALKSELKYTEQFTKRISILNPLWAILLLEIMSPPIIATAV